MSSVVLRLPITFPDYNSSFPSSYTKLLSSTDVDFGHRSFVEVFTKLHLKTSSWKFGWLNKPWSLAKVFHVSLRDFPSAFWLPTTQLKCLSNLPLHSFGRNSSVVKASTEVSTKLPRFLLQASVLLILILWRCLLLLLFYLESLKSCHIKTRFNKFPK